MNLHPAACSSGQNCRCSGDIDRMGTVASGAHDVQKLAAAPKRDGMSRREDPPKGRRCNYGAVKLCSSAHLAGTGRQALYIARTIPETSSGVSPLERSSASRAATCAGSAPLRVDVRS
eukprot:scaffold47_cov258-Pinguiococcus_pyrenoidosus.AAC.73